MDKQWMKTLNIPLTVLLVFQLTGCGTIFYPERRGQRGGHLDAGVVILDGIGLLFFLIPGVIAFAVDFSNGTIYLPEPLPPRTSLRGPNNIRQVKFDPKHSSMASIERTIKEETGYTVKLDGEKTEVTRLRTTDEMKARFTEVAPDIQNARLALSDRFKKGEHL